jgi:hypothetical protein
MIRHTKGFAFRIGALDRTLGPGRRPRAAQGPVALG